MDWKTTTGEGCCFISQLTFKSLLLTTHWHSKNVSFCC